MNRKNKLELKQAYIVDGKPMVLTCVNYNRYSFTDGRYGFGRTLGGRKSDFEILNNLKVAEGIDPQDILDKLKDSIHSMVQFYITKGNK